jgi:HEAT repeat protein
MDLVIFIGSEGHRQSVYLPLIRMMEREDHYHRALAMATLCCFNFPEAVNNLAMNFSQLSSAMRWVTIVLLKKRWDEKFVPVFLKALDDPDPEVVRVAILAMSRATAIAALEPIRKMLYSNHEVVVLTAINALVELGAENSAAELKALYESSDSQKVRATITAAFGELSSDDTIEFLTGCLKANDSRVRANAVIALKKKYEKRGFLAEHVVRAVSELKNDPDHRVKADCIQALWSMGLDDNMGEIEGLLLSADEASRSAGAYLCGKLKLHQLKKRLETLTGDQSWTVRKMSALALLAYGDSGLAILRALMDSGTPDQQIVAAYAVGLSDDPSAIEKLISQSRSGGEMAEMATSLLWRLARPALS